MFQGTKMAVTVIQVGEIYIAVSHHLDCGVDVESKVVFNLDGKERESLIRLKERARKKAREMGIPHVIGLDERKK